MRWQIGRMKRQATVDGDATGASLRFAERPIIVVIVMYIAVVDVDAVAVEASESRVENIPRHHL